MRVVFMGTPEFAATILEDLSQQHEVAAVYTRPDAVRGRGRKLEPSPVKRTAERLGLPVLEPRTLRDEAVQAELASFEPDVICVAAYGMLLPAEVLSIPEHGCLNVHASLLPRWRGAAPIERAILSGDEEAGVCIMRMEEGLDTGDYCVCRSLEVGDKDVALLTDLLADLGAHALLTALSQLEAGCIRWTRQDEEHVTYAEKIGKDELSLSPADTVELACRKVRASSAAHPAHAVIAGKDVTVLAARPAPADQADAVCAGMEPGSVRFVAKRLYLGAADGAIELMEVKPAGKAAMAAKAFAAGIQGIKEDTKTWEGPRG